MEKNTRSTKKDIGWSMGRQGSVGGENENYSRSIICHHKIKKRIRMVNVKVG